METYDRLTGLYSKEGIFGEVAKQLAEENAEKYSIICLDIKNFKLVNDVFGIPKGDQLLVNVGEVIREKAFEYSICSRFENDKFGIFIVDQYRQQVVDCIANHTFYVDGALHYPIHIDIGIYEVEDKKIPISIMCDRAFMALNTIKDDLQERVAFYNCSMREKVLKEQELIGDLQRAIDEKELQIYLQPQTDCGGMVAGAEALIRWQHPKKGLLMPGEFISVFENNGMIVRVDQYVWELACMQLKKWKEEGKGNYYISVNISTKDFYYIDVCEVLVSLVKKYGIDAENLKLEITETAIIQNLETQLKIIDQLHTEGFTVEMDDFGSGYSSLNMLKDIDVDVMKLDMKFLSKSHNEERSRKILRMMVALSKELGMPVIAEGVENQEQMQFLMEIGCDMFQGYYFAKPMTVEVFEQKYIFS